MKKNSDFTVPVNLSHSAAWHFAKKLTRAIFFTTCLITIFYISIEDFSSKKLPVSIFLIFEKAIEIFSIIFICLYVIGRQLPKAKRDYLTSFKRKVDKKIEKIEINQQEIEKHVEKEINEKKEMLRRFFKPLLAKLFHIEGTYKENKQSSEEFGKCIDKFDQALVSAKYNLYRNIGFCIKLDLQHYIVESLQKKERFFFDVDNWLDKFDFNSRREKIRKRMFNECISEKIELENTINKINDIAYQKLVYR